MIITYSLLLGYINFSYVSKLVAIITSLLLTKPIIKPILLELYILLYSRTLYIALILPIRLY